MLIPDPGFVLPYRIPINRQQKGRGKIFLSYLFCWRQFHKTTYRLLFNSIKKYLNQITKNLKYFSPKKVVKKLSEIWVLNPEREKTYPRYQSQKSTGSTTLVFKKCGWINVFKAKTFPQIYETTETTPSLCFSKEWKELERILSNTEQQEDRENIKV
jgi:hypothetical protein